MRKLAVALLTIAVVISVSACSTGRVKTAAEQQGITIPASAKISTAQQAELAHDPVTYDDYKAAFRRFSSCLAAKGYTIMGNGNSNEVIQYGVPAAAVDSGLMDKCYSYQFQWIDSIWQASRADTSNQAKAYAMCLTAEGTTPKKTESEKYDQLKKANIDPYMCYTKHFPDGDNG